MMSKIVSLILSDRYNIISSLVTLNNLPKPFTFCKRTFCKRTKHLQFNNKTTLKHTTESHINVTNYCINQKRFKWNLFGKKNFGAYDVIKEPGDMRGPCSVPSHIVQPDYAQTGVPSSSPDTIEIKTEEQIQGMRNAGHLARTVMNDVDQYIKVGISTDDINEVVHNKVTQLGAYPSPLNYKHFPKSVCTSVNNVTCHGIPDDRKLQDGDIISVDITVYYKGYHGDCCDSFLIGDVDPIGRHLLESARKCRDEAIAICQPGRPFAAIGELVQQIALNEGVTVVPYFAGHGIGDYFHGLPDIYHCYNKYPGSMEPGMTFTVEPVLSQGSKDIVILDDDWTAITKDTGRAAQFEHTILITLTGHEILTNYF